MKEAIKNLAARARAVLTSAAKELGVRGGSLWRHLMPFCASFIPHYTEKVVNLPEIA